MYKHARKENIMNLSTTDSFFIVITLITSYFQDYNKTKNGMEKVMPVSNFAQYFDSDTYNFIFVKMLLLFFSIF